MRSENLLRLSTSSHVYLSNNLCPEQLVLCCSWRHWWSVWNQIFFLLSAFREPWLMLIQRMAGCPKSPTPAEERKQCLSWKDTTFVISCPLWTVLLRTWQWRRNPFVMRGDKISQVVWRAQVWRGCLLLGLCSFSWDFVSCSTCIYRFVWLLLIGFFWYHHHRRLWWVSSHVLIGFVMNFSLAPTHLLSCFSCHSTLQSVLTYGAIVSETNSWQLDTVLVKTNKI